MEHFQKHSLIQHLVIMFILLQLQRLSTTFLINRYGNEIFFYVLYGKYINTYYVTPTTYISMLLLRTVAALFYIEVVICGGDHRKWAQI